MFNRSLTPKRLLVPFVSLNMAVTICTVAAFAQTTQFTYQGKLSDGGSLANGGYDFQFKLFDTVTLGTGAQQGSTQTLTNITVTNGIFTVQLDFGSCGTCFNGADRFLEIAVKLTSGSTFTTLGPRQPIAWTPYAVKSLNATIADGLSVACVSCITSSQIASVNGSAILGTIPPASVPPGSGSYIQNTASQQASSNFNVSGSGAVGGSLGIGTLNPGTRLEAVDAATQFRFGPTAADNGGYLVSTTPSQANLAGGARWNGSNWVAKSTEASLIEQTSGVTRFYANTGLTPGSAFLPAQRMIITSNGNVGIGISNPAGLLHVKGTSPVRILGDPSTLSGSEFVDFMARSSFFSSDLGGMRIQRQAATGNIDTLIFAAPAGSAASEMMRVTGNGNVGIGTSSPTQARLHVNGGFGNGVYGISSGSSGEFGVIGEGSGLADAGLFLGRVRIDGILRLERLGGSDSSLQMCRNSISEISLCSSSLRYKTDLRHFNGGIEIINHLKPITFTWKQSGVRDVGLGAEDVAEVEPLFTFRNDKGEIEGVKYDHLSVVFINAFKEQQGQIESQQGQIRERQRQASVQQQQIEQYRKQLAVEQQRNNKQQAQLASQRIELEALKRLVCASHPQASICRAMRRGR